MIEIKLNGEKHSTPENSNLSELLAVLNLNLRQIAIAKNLEVIPHSQLKETTLSDGDEIEIFHAVGGG